MDIRIDTPNSNARDEFTDEDYIYAPFEAAGRAEEDKVAREGCPVEDGTVEPAPAQEQVEYFEPTADASDFSDIPMTDVAGKIPEQETECADEFAEEEVVSKTEYDALMDRYQRLISDWDNYRRRTADDIAQAKANANRNMAEALIPTFDHFGFALAHSAQMEDNPAAQEVAKGFEAIYRAMLDSLSREGLAVIDPAPGSAFDMNENQAIEQVPGTGMELESIVRVVQVGYKFNDYVIRPAMVAVAS